MAIKTKLKTLSGREETLYVRINNIQENRHGRPITFLARGFASEEAFRDNFHYEWEKEYEIPYDQYDPDKGLRRQCYEFMKNDLESPEDS